MYDFLYGKLKFQDFTKNFQEGDEMIKNKIFTLFSVCVCAFCLAFAIALPNLSVGRAEEGFVRYEAEADSVETIDCQKSFAQTASGDVDGKNYVGKVDYATSRVNFSVNVPEEGNYTLRLAYCVKKSTATTVLKTDENLVYLIACTNASADWNKFDAKSVAETTVSLRAGEQTLSFRKGNSSVQFDYIELKRIGAYENTAQSPVSEGYVRYEAEDATLEAGPTVGSVAAASGFLYVGNVDYSTSRVKFSVDIPEEGNYSLNFGYCTVGKNATAVLTTEENFSYLMDCGTTSASWNDFGEASVATAEISLRQGKQTLSFRKGKSSVRFDYIELKKSGEYRVENSAKPEVNEGFIRYEAEDLIRTKEVSSEKATGASGKLYIGGINTSVGLTLQQEVEETGMYEIAVGYALARGKESRLELRVDGRTVAEPIADSGRGEYAFSSRTTVSSYIWLTAGSRKLEIYQSGTGARFDFVEVRKLTESELIAESLTVEVVDELSLHVYEGGDYDLAGIKVTLAYADGKGVRELTEEELSVLPPENYNPTAAGEYTFSVQYGGLSGSFVVTVHTENEPTPESLEIDTSGMSLTVPKGQIYEAKGISVSIRYSNGMTRKLSESDYTVVPPEGYSENTGKYEFTVVYLADETVTGTFEVTVVTRYEAENGETNATVKNSADASGGKYVGSIDKTSHYISFSVSVPQAGEYDMALAYAIGTGYGSAQFVVHNDKGVYAKVAMKNKNGWGKFTADAVVYTKISLPEGESAVTVYKYSGYAELDYIEIGEKTGEYKLFEGFPKPGPGEKPYLQEGYVRYEAEDASLSGVTRYGFAFVNDYGVYSGQGFVGGLDTDDRYIEFTVNVEEDGEYEIKLAYAVLGTASVKVYAGQYGAQATCFLYATPACAWVAPAWGQFSETGIATAKVCLKKGENFIRIKKGTANVQIDYLDFGARVGDYYEGATENASFGDGQDAEDGYARLPQGLSPLAIAAISVGGVLLIGGGVAVAVVIVKKRKRAS